MNRINFENGKTKADAETMNEFQGNIQTAIDENAENIATNAEKIATNEADIENLQAGKISDFKSISVTDYNNQTTTGFYYCNDGNTASNKAVASNGYLIVHRLNDNYIFQMFTSVGTGTSYVRVCNNGTWKAWTELMYKTGGTLTGQLTAQTVLPSANSAYDLGSAGALWRNIYFSNLIWNSNKIYESSGWGVWGAAVGLTVRNRDDLNTYMPVTALSFNINSSKRYKENIVNMTEDEANKLDEINVVKFDYKTKANGVNQTGVIAEDVYEVLPNVVTMAEIDGKKVPDSVDYSKFVPYLIKKVQMLEKRVSEFEGKEE